MERLKRPTWGALEHSTGAREVGAQAIGASVHRPAELIVKLLILCTPMSLLTLRTRALLHAFNHIHLYLDYFGTKGSSSVVLNQTIDQQHRTEHIVRVNSECVRREIEV